MKVMISQPMNGIPDDEIRRIRLELIEKFNKMHIEVIDSFFTEEAPEGTYYPNVFYLGRTIMQAICNVDAVYFVKGWNNARGCRIERKICEEYGIKILDENFFKNEHVGFTLYNDGNCIGPIIRSPIDDMTLVRKEMEEPNNARFKHC